MEIYEKTIIYYQTTNGKYPFEEWYSELDTSLKVLVDKRIEKLKKGLYGDHKPLQKSYISEIRMDFGKGYRIYYYDLTTAVIIFFAASDKKNQKKEIIKANEYYKDFMERLQNGTI